MWSEQRAEAAETDATTGRHHRGWRLQVADFKPPVGIGTGTGTGTGTGAGTTGAGAGTCT